MIFCEIGQPFHPQLMPWAPRESVMVVLIFIHIAYADSHDCSLIHVGSVWSARTATNRKRRHQDQRWATMEMIFSHSTLFSSLF